MFCLLILGASWYFYVLDRVWGNRYYTGQWHSFPFHSRWAIEVFPLCGLCTPSSYPPLVVEPWLVLAGQWEGFNQANQLQGLAMTTDLRSAVLMSSPQNSGALMPRVCPSSMLHVEVVAWWCFQVV
ncbi:hypothetical protein HJG60_010312 [Phyllostomus discolor]|uniref:Uncharacterized protein n=1 Tax=Phyllostomus discolor TaxID=89673 RepID=A0A834B2I9_9CHIR|nr:hypothetical protein HJG60_010312 [Phyllostomus discolor]